MPKVLIVNHTTSPQGFHETSTPPGESAPVMSQEATFLKPGQSMVMHLPEEHLGDSHIPPGVSVFRDYTDAEVAVRGASHSPHAKSLTATSDDGARAAAGANARPAQAVAAGDGPGPVVAADDFDAMSDEELRAHITTASGRAPHPATGREKLLTNARGAGQDEAVG